MYNEDQPDDYNAAICDETNEQSENLNGNTFSKTINNKAKW